MAVTMGEINEIRDGWCIATARTTGQRCGRRAMKGTNHCIVHSGADKRRKNQPAWKAFDEFGVLYDPDAPPVTDPVASLQKLGGVADHAVDVAGRKVNELESWQSTDMKGTTQLRQEIELWSRMVTRAESIFTTLAKLGIDERRVQVAEREQLLIIAALRSIAGDPELALTPGQRQAWESVVPRHLKAILSTDDQ